MVTLLVLMLGLAKRFFGLLPDEWRLTLGNVQSLNSKIQIALVAVIFLSFLVIAIITGTYLNTFIKSQKQLVIDEKLENVSSSFKSKTLIAQSKAETVEILSNYQQEIEETHNIEMDIFPIEASTTGLDYFTRMYFSKQSAPQSMSLEAEGKPSSYVPILHSGTLAGIAQVVQLNKNAKTNVTVLDFLGSIFNVYVFLFLLASVLSIFMAQTITRPLAILNRSMNSVSLGKNNEKIDWREDDEIGVLISNYNTMVSKLEESAEILAKKERDTAWREMAKQVAHEIKNPLTPMRLSIQYLEQAISRQPANAKEITKKISTTMLEQIDNLTGIAEAFGNLAKLPQTSNVDVELNSVVEAVHNLFRKREDMDISLSVPIDPIHAFADKGQLIRILNNLVKNAIESIPTTRHGKIAMHLSVRNGKAIIEVKDNGSGIPQDMQDKIFQPKFTTKDSGSGLGLAIAANMIESMNGRIYFESTPGISTSFFIELDLIREAVSDKEERIPLD